MFSPDFCFLSHGDFLFLGIPLQQWAFRGYSGPVFLWFSHHCGVWPWHSQKLHPRRDACQQCNPLSGAGFWFKCRLPATSQPPSSYGGWTNSCTTWKPYGKPWLVGYRETILLGSSWCEMDFLHPQSELGGWYVPGLEKIQGRLKPI